MKKTCQQCNREFQKTPSNSKEYWERKRFCSRKCYGLSIRHDITNSKICSHCGQEFFRKLNEGANFLNRKYCSHLCSEHASKGREGKPQTHEHKAKMVATRRANGSYRKGCGKGRTLKGLENSRKAKRNWKLKNKEKVNFHTRIRRYRLRGAEGNHSYSEWLELKRKYNNMCLCCKRFEPEIELTEDHIVPILLGGSNDISNIQPLCKSCNSQKFTSIIDYRNLFGYSELQPSSGIAK
jgi:5-methylcytosine-specific restriction endonuclease McrA